MWTCKNCKSENEDNFDICWSCGSDISGIKTIETSQEDVFKNTKEEAVKFIEDKHKSNLKESRGAVISFAAVLLAAFFMPWIKIFENISAWDLIFGEVGEFIDSKVKYLGLLLPLSAIVILYGTALSQGNYPIGKRFLFSLPFITLVILGIIIHHNFSDGGDTRHGGDNIFQVFSLGFWLTIISSIFLCIIGVFSGSLIETEINEPKPLVSFSHEIPSNNEAYVDNTTQPKSNQASLVEQLERIQKMKIEGLITDDEYHKMKNKIIATFD